MWDGCVVELGRDRDKGKKRCSAPLESCNLNGVQPIREGFEITGQKAKKSTAPKVRTPLHPYTPTPDPHKPNKPSRPFQEETEETAWQGVYVLC